MVFREIIVTVCKNLIKDINTLGYKKQILLVLQQVEHVVSLSFNYITHCLSVNQRKSVIVYSVSCQSEIPFLLLKKKTRIYSLFNYTHQHTHGHKHTHTHNLRSLKFTLEHLKRSCLPVSRCTAYDAQP